MSLNISDPIQYAIRKTMERIPHVLLQEAFTTYKSRSPFEASQLNKGVEHSIESIIIRRTVAADCNMTGGKLKDCVLTPDLVERTENRAADYRTRPTMNTVYRIPAVERENRDIVKVIGVHNQAIGIVNSSQGSFSNSSSMQNQMRNVLGAQSFNDVPFDPAAKILAPDLVQIEAPTINHIHWVLSFMVAYPDNFGNINTSSLPAFAKLVLHACQMFIFNTLVIDIDQAATRGGITIGAFRDMLYKYEDAPTLYQEALDEFNATERYDPRVFAELIHFCI